MPESRGGCASAYLPPGVEVQQRRRERIGHREPRRPRWRDRRTVTTRSPVVAGNDAGDAGVPLGSVRRVDLDQAPLGAEVASPSAVSDDEDRRPGGRPAVKTAPNGSPPIRPRRSAPGGPRRSASTSRSHVPASVEADVDDHRIGRRDSESLPSRTTRRPTPRGRGAGWLRRNGPSQRSHAPAEDVDDPSRRRRSTRPSAPGSPTPPGPARRCSTSACEQTVLRLRGVREPEGLGGQEEGQVERPGGRRQGGEPVRVGDQRGPRAPPAARAPPARWRPGRRRAPPPARPRAAASGAGRRLAVGPLLRVACSSASAAALRRVEELLLQRRQLGVRAGRPSRGRRRAGRPGTARRPVGRRPAHSRAAGARCRRTARPGGVVLQPPGQPRPGGEQRLVGDLEPVAVHGEQPPADEDLDHRPPRGPAGPVQVQLGERHRTPDQRAAVVGVGQPDEQPPGELPAGLVQRRRRRPRRTGSAHRATPPASR